MINLKGFPGTDGAPLDASGGTRLRATVLCALLAFGQAARGQDGKPADEEFVGHGADGRVVTPVNQILTPFGRQIELPGMRPQAIVLSPDGKLLVTAGKTSEIVVLDPATGEIRQRVKLPGETPADPAQQPVSSQVLEPDRQGQLSYTGLIFSPDGSRLYMSNVDGSVKVFGVDAMGTVSPERTFALPAANAPRRKAEIPAGLAVSDDGRRLYVCGNLSNRLLELDTESGETLRTFEVGVAPYDVRIVSERAYVSNWGGRRPGEGDLTGPAGRGTVVRVDPRRSIANDGSLSVIDLASGSHRAEIITGLHPCGLATSGEHPYLVCCNAASDDLSIIDTRTDTAVARIWVKANAADLLGAAPNAAAFDASGRRLYVANGSQNAIAVVEFDRNEPEESRLAGLIPVGWYPGALALDQARGTIDVANIKGLPSEPRRYREGSGPEARGFNSHHYQGSVTLAPIPEASALAGLSERVARNLRAPRIADAILPPRPDQPERPIPERIGEPSPIKHVVYVIKENRTYDQVLGACGRGNSDPSLCIFGPEITPNQHKIAEDFVLLDNTYCCGILSADGHQWSATAYSTDYMEKSFAGFPRSYPDGMGTDENDALAYAPSGFLWDNALEHGVSVRNYGEFMGPSVHWKDKSSKGSPGFSACYEAWKSGSDDVVFESWPSLETMRPFSPTDYVGWDMSVPDQFRADYVLRELAEFEAEDRYPQLTIICLPQDHTSGTSHGAPTPAACVADNDLALGRILEGLSHSKFWPEMAVFVIEDDPQAGWDHVSGYRTIAFCASPYAKRGQIVSTQYNTTSVIRTIEQILGLPPMNAFDASAVPMFDCFALTPDPTPYTALPTNVPLDQMNPVAMEIKDRQLREDAIISASLNFHEVDRAPEDVLNRILWHAMRGNAPYPEWASGAPDEDDE
ncbi:MAG: bifunctional YncE family protein/alkaline phosphatase family protein [Phycisphaerales bacterium]|nr:bifunctional YncE family protein/alkaline phosphatase family protein [Phycisphaerales bacterium]